MLYYTQCDAETVPGESCSVADELSRERRKTRSLEDENEQLRGIFTTATDQFEALNRRIESLENEVSAEKKNRQELELENRRLKKELSAEKAKANKFADMLFGLKSEKLKLSDLKVVDEDTLSVNEPDCTGAADEKGKEKGEEKKGLPKKKPPGGQKGHKGHGRKIPKNLPIVDRHIHLSEGETFYGIPAESWVEQGGMYEISYMVRKEVTWYVERIIRHKSAPPPGSEPGVPKLLTAPMPDKIIPQGKYGLEVWVDVLIDKYQQHIPVQRQIFAAQQSGVNLIPGTVFGGLKTIYSMHLKPLYEQLIVALQKGERLHGDETRWYMLSDAMKKLWYMWGFKSESVTVFVLDSTRSAAVPAKALLGIDDLTQIKEPVEIPKERMKILNVDRYSAYKALANLALIILSFCWAHVRRDFTDIIKKYPDENNLIKWAEEWLVKISRLYRINNERVKHSRKSKLFLEYDTKLRKAIETMKNELDTEVEYDEDTVHIARLKAMKSMKNHWDGLIVFVDNPEVPMDNNRMENGIRPCALGRKNYIGNHSEWGGELSACMYSIIQTCIQNGINPKAYLNYYFTRSIKAEGKMDENEINSMLPGNLQENIIAEYDLSLKKF